MAKINILQIWNKEFDPLACAWYIVYIYEKNSYITRLVKLRTEKEIKLTCMLENSCRTPESAYIYISFVLQVQGIICHTARR